MKLAVATVFVTDKELLRGKGHRLSDQQLGLLNGSTITVCMRVKGGSRSAGLTAVPGLIRLTYDQPDMITLDNSPTQPRAVMPCGHVIS